MIRCVLTPRPTNCASSSLQIICQFSHFLFMQHTIPTQTSLLKTSMRFLIHYRLRLRHCISSSSPFAEILYIHLHSVIAFFFQPERLQWTWTFNETFHNWIFKKSISSKDTYNPKILDKPCTVEVLHQSFVDESVLTDCLHQIHTLRP